MIEKVVETMVEREIERMKSVALLLKLNEANMLKSNKIVRFTVPNMQEKVLNI